MRSYYGVYMYPDSVLSDAIEEGSLEKVKEARSFGAKLNRSILIRAIEIAISAQFSTRSSESSGYDSDDENEIKIDIIDRTAFDDIVDYLIEEGIEVSWLLLDELAQNNKISILNYLLANGKVNKEELKDYALERAILYGKENMAHLLIQYDAKCTLPTILNYAVLGRSVDIFSLVLARNPCLDAVDGTGRTPLMNAMSIGNQKMISMLIEAGADTGCKDLENKTAEMHAKNHTIRMHFLKCVEEKNVSVNALRNQLTQFENTREKLLSKKYSVSETEEKNINEQEIVEMHLKMMSDAIRLSRDHVGLLPVIDNYLGQILMNVSDLLAIYRPEPCDKVDQLANDLRAVGVGLARKNMFSPVNSPVNTRRENNQPDVVAQSRIECKRK